MFTCVRNLGQGPLLWRDFVIAQHNLKLSWGLNAEVFKALSSSVI